MARPPGDLNREQFIAGKGLYTTLRLAIARGDRRLFRIEPAPIPVKSVVAWNLLIAAFAVILHWLLRTHAAPGVGLTGAHFAPALVGITACAGYTSFTVWAFVREGRRGPWLIYDRRTRRVTLPRQGVEFDRSEILHLRYVTTKNPDRARAGDCWRRSELHVVTCRDGRRERWHLLNSLSTGALEHLLRPLVKETDIPVERIEDSWFGWKLRESRFEA
jgi:hypothetical protein